MLRIGALRGSVRKRASRKLAALRATQTSGCLIRLRPPLLGAAPKGPNTGKLAVARARLGFLCCIRRAPNPTRAEPQAENRLAGVGDSRCGPGVCIQARCTATETRSGDGCPAHCAGAYSMSEDRQSDPSSVRIPSPLRVGVHRRSRRCARVSFSFAYFLLDKQKKVSRTAVRNQRFDKLVSTRPPSPGRRSGGGLAARTLSHRLVPFRRRTHHDHATDDRDTAHDEVPGQRLVEQERAEQHAENGRQKREHAQPRGEITS